MTICPPVCDLYIPAVDVGDDLTGALALHEGLLREIEEGVGALAHSRPQDVHLGLHDPAGPVVLNLNSKSS